MPQFPITLIHVPTGQEYRAHTLGELYGLGRDYQLREPVAGIDLRVYQPPARGEWPEDYRPAARPPREDIDPTQARRAQPDPAYESTTAAEPASPRRQTRNRRTREDS